MKIDNMINNILGKKVHSINLFSKKKNDFDGDGVINRKDCNPFNIMKQDKTSVSCSNCGNTFNEVKNRHYMGRGLFSVCCPKCKECWETGSII